MLTDIQRIALVDFMNGRKADGRVVAALRRRRLIQGDALSLHALHLLSIFPNKPKIYVPSMQEIDSLAADSHVSALVTETRYYGDNNSLEIGYREYYNFSIRKLLIWYRDLCKKAAEHLDSKWDSHADYEYGKNDTIKAYMIREANEKARSDSWEKRYTSHLLEKIAKGILEGKKRLDFDTSYKYSFMDTKDEISEFIVLDEDAKISHSVMIDVMS